MSGHPLCTYAPDLVSPRLPMPLLEEWPPGDGLQWGICGNRSLQPYPVFLPGESKGHGSLVGCRLWGRTESDKTEAT